MPQWQVEPLVNELKAMKKRMDTLYQRSCGGSRDTAEQAGCKSEWRPQVDVLETEDEWLFIADLPGVHEDDLHVEVVDNALRISGNRPLAFESSTELGGKVRAVRTERVHGPFSRSLTIPSDAQQDAIQAEFKLGVLKVLVPKQRAAKPAQHKVTVHSL